jgi:pimeloyl-ACP methyl ester carboxylesterase
MRSLKLMARMLALVAIALVLLLLSCQSRLMYFPRPYGKASLWDLEQRKGKQIEYTTSQGKQVAFYLPPRADAAGAPSYLWIISGGNGSLALDYSEEPMHWDAQFGYLFVDYPGYGMCAGSPNPKRIEESTVAAAEALRKDLGWSEEEFRARTGVFGHSIGCAAALMAADDLQLKSAVLCSPFTTMTDMGRQILGWPLCYLNMHRFDNVSRLKALDTRGASVRIFHGAEDEIIPVTMSRRMQEMFPRTVQFTEVPEGRHNDVVMRARTDIGKAMRDLAVLR